MSNQNFNVKSLSAVSFFLLAMLVSCKSPFMDYASDSNNASEVRPTSQPTEEESTDNPEIEPTPEESEDISTTVSVNARCDLFFSNINICAEKNWVVGPLIPVDGSGAVLKFQFFDKSSRKIVTGLDAKLTFWSHMMHGNDYQDDVDVDKVKIDQGIWIFKNINLSCKGADWDVILRVKSDTFDWQSAKFIWTQFEFLGE